jgi:hypothetical protein
MADAAGQRTTRSVVPSSLPPSPCCVPGGLLQMAEAGPAKTRVFLFRCPSLYKLRGYFVRAFTMADAAPAENNAFCCALVSATQPPLRTWRIFADGRGRAGKDESFPFPLSLSLSIYAQRLFAMGVILRWYQPGRAKQGVFSLSAVPVPVPLYICSEVILRWHKPGRAKKGVFLLRCPSLREF